LNVGTGNTVKYGADYGSLAAMKTLESTEHPLEVPRCQYRACPCQM